MAPTSPLEAFSAQVGSSFLSTQNTPSRSLKKWYRLTEQQIRLQTNPLHRFSQKQRSAEIKLAPAEAVGSIKNVVVPEALQRNIKDRMSQYIQSFICALI